MPDIFDEVEVEQGPALDVFDELAPDEKKPTPVPQIKLDAYEQARMQADPNRGMEPMGTMGPANPEEIRNIPELLSIPGKAAVAVADIPTRLANWRRGGEYNYGYVPTLSERPPVPIPEINLTKEDEAALRTSANPLDYYMPEMTGLHNVGVRTVNKLVPPFAPAETGLTLPLLASPTFAKAAAVAFGSAMALEMPAQVINSLKVLKDPESSTSDKIAAIGEPGVDTILAYTMVKHGLTTPKPKVSYPTGRFLRDPGRVQPPPEETIWLEKAAEPRRVIMPEERPTQTLEERVADAWAKRILERERQKAIRERELRRRAEPGTPGFLQTAEEKLAQRKEPFFEPNKPEPVPPTKTVPADLRADLEFLPPRGPLEQAKRAEVIRRLQEIRRAKEEQARAQAALREAAGKPAPIPARPPTMPVRPSDLRQLQAVMQANQIKLRGIGRPLRPAEVRQVAAQTTTPDAQTNWVREQIATDPRLQHLSGLIEVLPPEQWPDQVKQALARRGDMTPAVAGFVWGDRVILNPRYAEFAEGNSQAVLDTAWHEAAGHYGIQRALGKDKFSNLTQQIWKSLTDEERTNISKRNSLAPEKTGIIGEEWLMYEAERVVREGKTNTVWSRIADLFRQGARAIGFTVRFSDTEIATLINKGYESAKEVQQTAATERGLAAIPETRPEAHVSSQVEGNLPEDSPYATRFRVQALKKTVQTNKGEREIRIYEVSLTPKTASAIMDKAAKAGELSMPQARELNAGSERVADYEKIYAKADRYDSWDDIIRSPAKGGKLVGVEVLQLTKGCGRALTTIERVANGILPNETRIEACYGGDCWVNKTIPVKFHTMENMEVRDVTLADPKSFSTLLTPQRVERLNNAPFIREGYAGDSSHAIATGVALEWLKAAKAAGIKRKTIFISAGYAPVTDAQYAALLPYKDMFELHFSNSGWFHKNEIMLRLAEFNAARKAGLPVQLRLITNSGKVGDVDMVNFPWLYRKLREMGVKQDEILETPFHDDDVPSTARAKNPDSWRSLPSGLFRNVCCETHACKTCAIKCMTKPVAQGKSLEKASVQTSLKVDSDAVRRTSEPELKTRMAEEEPGGLPNPESKDQTGELKNPERDWDLFAENLRDDLESFRPARDTGRLDYEMLDVADRFVEYAKADKSGKPLDKLVSDFAKNDEASASQIRKLRTSVKSLISGEEPTFRMEDLPEPVLKDLQELRNIRRGIGWRFTNRGALEAMSYLKGAANNMAADFAQNIGNEIQHQLWRDLLGTAKPDARARWLKRTLPGVNPHARIEEALTFVRESGNDLSKLQADRALVSSAPDPSLPPVDLALWRKARARALDRMDFAIANFNDFIPTSKAYGKATLSEALQEHAAGIETPIHENYVMHAQDIEGPVDIGIFSSGQRKGDNVQFKKARAYPDLASSIAAGIRPVSMNAIDLLKARLNAGQRNINNRAWVEDLKTMTDDQGKPIAAPITTRSIGGPFPRTEQVVPDGYQRVNFLGADLAVRDGFAGLFNNLTEPSKFAASPIGHAVMMGTHTGKHTMLLFDTFHLGRLSFWASIIQHKPAGYRRGLLLLDNTIPELQRMAATGDIPSGYLKDVVRNKYLIENVALKTGYNVAGVSDNLYSSLTEELPLFGAFNKFLFKEFQRGAMTEAWLYEFDRVRKENPGMTVMEAGRKVSKDLNTRFGALNEQSVIKSKTFRDIARLLFLAPQWNEGLITSELVGLGQLLKAPIDSAKAGRIVTGTLGRAIGTLFVAQFAANQIINYATRGHPTWKNPEEGEDAKLSAYIPDVTDSGAGYLLSPMSLPLETIHLLVKGYERNGNFADAVRQYITSRLSFTSRPAYTALAKRDRFDRVIPSQKYWQEVLLSLIPVPISAGSATRLGKEMVGRGLAKSRGEEYRGTRQEFPGQYQKQAMASMGVKTENAPNSVQRISRLAKEFMREKGEAESAEFYSGDFSKMTQLLNVGNFIDAKAELENNVLKKKTPREVQEHFRRAFKFPFTKSKAREREFYATLSPEQQRTYEAARERRRNLSAKAVELVDQVVNEQQTKPK